MSVRNYRVEGANASAAVKVAARVATTGNITLSGIGTVDGIALAAEDRILVKNQTISSENGVYAVSANDWSRTQDFTGQLNAVTGTLIFVNEGSVNAETMWKTSADTDPINIGVDDVNFVSVPITGFITIEVDTDTTVFEGQGEGTASSPLKAHVQNLSTEELLSDMLVELKKTNIYLSLMTDLQVKNTDVE